MIAGFSPAAVKCWVCKKEFKYYVSIDGSENPGPPVEALAEKFIATGPKKGIENTAILKVQVKCPGCGIVNEYIDVLNM